MDPLDLRSQALLVTDKVVAETQKQTEGRVCAVGKPHDICPPAIIGRSAIAPRRQPSISPMTITHPKACNLTGKDYGFWRSDENRPTQYR